MRRFFSRIFRAIKKKIHTLLHDVFSGVEVFAESHLEFYLPVTRESHPFSKWLRPAFQHRRVRAILGANLAGAMILVSSVSPTTGAADEFPEAEMPVLSEDQVVVLTETRFQRPVDTLGLSQRFHGFHPGIDLRAVEGAPIYPIAKGKVVEVVYGRFGYGLYVLVEHADGFSSLSAHLSSILVRPGQEVTQETVLGGAGRTGWATGSHLHLEVYEDGRAINPLTVVPLE